MDKYKDLLYVSEEIENNIRSLSEEMSNVEYLYVKQKVNHLKKENEELERIIGTYLTVLVELETAKGRKCSLFENGNKSESRGNEATCSDNDMTSHIVRSPSESLRETQIIQMGKREDKKALKKDTSVKKGINKKITSSESELPLDIGRLDLKVGKILEIKKHEEADTLYVEKIDIGTAQPITVVSGLVKHVPIEEMRNRLVVVLCNLKPAKMRGVLSEAMVMCACTPEKVEVLSPSPTSKPGDMVTVPGYPPPFNGPEAVLNPKKKIFETLAPDLKTDSACYACFRDVRWEVPGGFVKSATLSRVNIK